MGLVRTPVQGGDRLSSNRVQEKLARAQASLARVQEHTPSEPDAFQTLGIVKDGIYKNLEDGIQSLLDACALIVKEHEIGVPNDEYGFNDLLLQSGHIEKVDKELLDDLRGLRNRLVHRYGPIDDAIVHARITDSLKDITRLIETLREASEGT